MRDQAEPICDGPGKTNPCLTTNSENDKIVIAALKESGNNFIAADVMELADMQDLGSCAARRAGSSPVIRINTGLRALDISSAHSFFTVFYFCSLLIL